MVASLDEGVLFFLRTVQSTLHYIRSYHRQAKSSGAQLSNKYANTQWTGEALGVAVVQPDRELKHLNLKALH